jgi:hypothetical protein
MMVVIECFIPTAGTALSRIAPGVQVIHEGGD